MNRLEQIYNVTFLRILDVGKYNKTIGSIIVGATRIPHSFYNHVKHIV